MKDRLEKARRLVDEEMFCVLLDSAGNPDEIGGKATNLGKARALGHPIPSSVVLKRNALTLFLQDSDLANEVDEYIASFGSAGDRQLRAAHDRLCRKVRSTPVPSEAIRELFVNVEPWLESAPAGLAVRSSYVYEDSSMASYAGVFESTLGARDRDQLLDGIVQCWCSTWSPRAIRYMHRMGLRPEADGMTVLVQEVIPAEVSGVVTTAVPTSGDPFHFEIHAVKGLSTDLMSGTGIGDVLSVRWDTGEIVSKELVSRSETAQACVTDHQASKITALARSLDDAWSLRLEIEWAISAEELWLIQVRPQTGLPDYFPAELTTGQQQITWSRQFFVVPLRSDVPPNYVTPLYGDMSESEFWFRYQPDDIILTGVHRMELDACGYRYSADVESRTFLDYFEDPTAMESWLERNEPPYRARWESREGELQRMKETASAALADTSSAAELIPATLSVRDQLWDLNSFGWSAPQAFGWMYQEVLRYLVKQVSADIDSDSLLGGLISYSFAKTQKLQRLGRAIYDMAVTRSFQTVGLSDVFSHIRDRHPECRFLEEYEALCWQTGMTPPSWRERPPFWSTGWEHIEALLAIKGALSGTARDIESLRADAERKSKQLTISVLESASDHRPELSHRLEKAIKQARYWTQALNDRHGLATGLLWEKELIWNLGLRLQREGIVDLPDDVLVFYKKDLERFAEDKDASKLSAVYAERKHTYRANLRLTPPETIGSPAEGPVDTPPPQVVRKESTSKSETGCLLSGRGLVAGRTAGRARVVTDLYAHGLVDKLSIDDILVLPHEHAFVYADWHSLLTVIKGVVSPGRPSHHLTQVARECGVPVIGFVEGDLSQIEDGAAIHIDGTSGRISRAG